MSVPFKAAIDSNVLQPPSNANSANASRVPDVGGGPKTSIFTAGREESISDHIAYGFGINSPAEFGTSFAKARNICCLVTSILPDFLEFASTIPSKPIFASIGVIPLAAHFSASDDLIRLEALVISGVLSPTPAQNNFIPPPDPVDSTTGVLNAVDFPKRSATVVENGKTVDEPTILI